MRYYSWKTELLRISLPVTAVAGACTIFDLGVWPLFVTALLACGWLLRSLQHLSDWLYSGANSEPPEAMGMWGQVFDVIYDMQRDATQNTNKLQAMIDYLHSSFASMSDAVVMLDPQGNIEWCNASANELLGLRESDDVGRQLVNLIRSPAFLRYFEAESYQTSLEMMSPVNNHINLSVSVSFFGQRNRLLFARDVTRTHRLEKMRKDFVANVSHELRTPLTVINGYLETFSEHGGENARWDRAVSQMLQQSRRMHMLIQDLMLLSRLEAVPKAGEESLISMRSLMEMIREECATAAKGERNLLIECDDSVAISGSANELRSAFSNLAMNAARYTSDKDTIILRWYCDDNHAYFEVEDTGIGIEPQYIPRLTERFYRVDQSRSIDTGGTGLGLAIVKHVLIRHRAELRIRSVPDQGSVFSCVFPRSAAVETVSS
ncbi:Phosphate regulon sensor protein PhoR [Zhongshania aliphaticivorans]|uniref:Phosphate regulon sensor protein PhoR n=1 Tax=Zhongshania aliphaticivorans TaxID=1470434 RepID=A0A5S9NIF6_9GAMM|nr:phosphate regulon sensor histidine kinase PhoR [Zhongshania aliphaticivorans]CAA0089803.1 Phosphate regulon sensor protein PhoR [Zhongshania aliphaticivorans]CAA0096827.1 Phosphate regulon sensor protein PhoR [Zhongshania aliphaticivorans]